MPLKTYIQSYIAFFGLLTTTVCACHSGHNAAVPLKPAAPPAALQTTPAAAIAHDIPPATAGTSDTSAWTLSAADSRAILSLCRANDNFSSNEELSIAEDAFRLGDISYVFIKSSGNVGGKTWLLAYRNGKIIKCAELASNYDSDLSWSEYDYKEFERTQDTLFTVRLITERVKNPKLVEDGHIKGNKTREDVPTVTDTVTARFTLSQFLQKKAADWPKVWEVVK